MKKIILIVSVLGLLLIITEDSQACTTFIISGKYTIDGKPLLYKNRDTDEMHNSLRFFSDGKYRYIGLVDGNEDWNKNVWGGYNETGFAIMNSAAYNNNLGDTSKFQDQEGVVMKLALQTCRTLEDFENLLRTLPKPLGVDANFGVIDAYGGAAFYETGNYKFIRYDANDPVVAPDGILIRTNHSMSADITKGFGFCRYNTTAIALKKAVAEKNFSPRYLFHNISRNLSHSLTGTDLSANLPEIKATSEFKFFIDYIPRQITSAVILIVGAKDEKHIKDATMWTILGFPLTSVAVPVWISAGDHLPDAVAMSDSLRSPLCTAALKFKEDCFPITYDRGTNYINLSAVINKENSGYMQILQSVETEIFEKAGQLTEGLEKGKKSEKDILDYYKWIDQYLLKSYNDKFHYTLFSN